MFHVKIVKMHLGASSAFFATGSERMSSEKKESIGHTFCMFHLGCWAEMPFGVKESTNLIGDDGEQLTIMNSSCERGKDITK